jgi:hypothetical protein
VLSRILLLIPFAPLALGFIIVACLAAGPTEVFKALTGRK